MKGSFRRLRRENWNAPTFPATASPIFEGSIPGLSSHSKTFKAKRDLLEYRSSIPVSHREINRREMKKTGYNIRVIIYKITSRPM
jgi:hypothetical protein